MKKTGKVTKEDLEAVESPPLTEAMLSSMRPVSAEHPLTPKRVRGPQRRPVKISTTIRLNSEVIEAFKATGRGWQSRVNDVLQEWLNEHKRV